MNDATFADCRVECGRQHFSPTSYCQLNITYRCGEISIGYYVTIIRERNSVVDRSRREEKVRKERRRKKKKRERIFCNGTRNKCNTSKKSIRVRSSAPSISLSPSTSNRIHFLRATFISDQFHRSETEQIHFGLIITTII